MSISRAPSAVSALSERLETRFAAKELAASLRARSEVRPDILVVFASFHHRALFSDALEILRSELHPAHVLACTTEGVVSDNREVERTPGMSALALRLPGVAAHPFSFGLADGPPSVWSDGFIRERVALPPDHGTKPHRGILMLADPFSIHAGRACEAIERAAQPGRTRIFGGVASGSTQPGLNALAVDRRVVHEGIVGLSLFGDVILDGLVSHGCRAIGPCLVVTRARGNEIIELGGRSALEVVQEVAERSSEDEHECLSHGILVGLARDSSKPRLGRDDFLIRPVLEIDRLKGTLRVTDDVKTGATVRLHARDVTTAHADLSMLLSAEQLRSEPAAALLFTCNMRGSRLFPAGDHDAASISTRLGGIPMAGFHCAGEIGPIGDHSFVHTQTAAAVLFRAASPGPA